MFLSNLYAKYKFDIQSDRLGPDCIFTHWRLFFKKSMIKLCKKKFARFGDGAEFRPYAYAIVTSKIFIGKSVIIRPNTMLFAYPSQEKEGSIYIEDDVMIGSGVHIYVANHRFDLNDKNIIKQGHSKPKSVYIKEGAWIGANSIILPGVTIGKNSVVGAGSVVTKSFPDRVLVAGNPAKIIKYLDK